MRCHACGSPMELLRRWTCSPMNAPALAPRYDWACSGVVCQGLAAV